MNFISKIFLIFWIVLVGCSSPDGAKLREWMKDSEKKKILSTTAQVGDLVTAVGGIRVENWVLIQGDLDPHSYELVKGDDEKFLRADAIFCNGLGLEHGASLSAILKANPKSLAVGETIAARHPEKILKKGGVVDPHIWMDISLWNEGVGPIVEKLSEIDPEGAAYFQERGEILSQKLLSVHEKLREEMRSIPEERRYLMTSHDAFRYFTKSYLAEPGEENWSSRFAAPEGLAPDGQINPYDIQRMIEFVRAKRVSVVFPESNVSRDSIRKIASAGHDLGLEVRVCKEPLYGDAMGGLSYEEMMEKNGEVLARNLR